MKVVILAGGFGTRLGDFTEHVPKPMVKIGGKPIIWHIMQNYAHFNYKNFYLALGYKAEIIKNYFLNYRSLNSNFKLNLRSGDVVYDNYDGVDWNVTLVDTAESTMTGGRVKRMEPYIGQETFMLTYGDGVSNINLDDLLSFHRSHGKLATITAVRPIARFGELELAGDLVTNFKEKPQTLGGWINGGFFVFEPEFFNFISDDSTHLEYEPLERALKANQLMAFRHEGFWHCLDTKRDLEKLENLYTKGAPWIVNPKLK